MLVTPHALRLIKPEYHATLTFADQYLPTSERGVARAVLKTANALAEVANESIWAFRAERGGVTRRLHAHLLIGFGCDVRPYEGTAGILSGQLRSRTLDHTWLWRGHYKLSLCYGATAADYVGSHEFDRTFVVVASAAAQRAMQIRFPTPAGRQIEELVFSTSSSEKRNQGLAAHDLRERFAEFPRQQKIR